MWDSGDVLIPRLLRPDLLPASRDRTTFPPADRLPFGGALRPYQEAALRALRDAGRDALVVAPCGGGKTIVGLAVVAERPTPALVLVHTLDLARQWMDRTLGVLGLVATLVGGGKAQAPDRITVATMQTLDRWTDREVFDFGSNFGFIIADEAHHAPCLTLARLLLLLPCRYRLGLTATPERADGLHPILYWHLGEPCHRIEAEDLQDCGATLAADYEVVRTGIVPPDGLEWVALISWLTEDCDRNKTITDLVIKLATHDGRQILVLTDRKAHARELFELLGGETGPFPDGELAVLTSDSTAKQRAAVLAAARAGTVRVLFATSLADEGLDLPGLDTLILACPSRIAGRLVQRVGRILRPAPGKRSPLILDLVDDSGPLMGLARKRRRILREEGIVR